MSLPALSPGGCGEANHAFRVDALRNLQTTMYLRPDHAEASISALRAFIRANPLGILITALDSAIHPLLQCSHIPWVLDVDDESSETELGTLRGHMARANPQARAMVDMARSGVDAEGSDVGKLEQEVLVLFNGPVHHYVSAKFNVETKPATGKVVPTWNYSAVQAYGIASLYYDMKSESTAAFLGKQISDLSFMAETQVMGFEKPWMPDDAPESYIRTLTKAIIGVEIKITRLGGKYKMSQEQSPGDRAGIIDGFEKLGTETGLLMAKTVKERCELSDAQKAAKQAE